MSKSEQIYDHTPQKQAGNQGTYCYLKSNPKKKKKTPQGLGFACYPCVCVGFLWALWFLQKYASKWISYAKFTLGA